MPRFRVRQPFGGFNATRVPAGFTFRDGILPTLPAAANRCRREAGRSKQERQPESNGKPKPALATEAGVKTNRERV